MQTYLSNVDSNEHKLDYNCHELNCLMEQQLPLKAHTITSEGLVEFKIEDGSSDYLNPEPVKWS